MMTVLSNPYVGPRSFETGEVLYGRDRELRSLTALLISERIVLLHSPSGAGKTSLVKAGLLPFLIGENFTVLPVVRVNIEPPSDYRQYNRYLISTMISLEEGYPESQRIPFTELAAMNLNEYLDQRTPQKDIAIVFDQFEEVLTISPEDRDSKQAFFAELGTALRNKQRWALFSMREDYLGALAPYVRPIPNRLVTRFRLDLLGNDAAMQAMQKPAQAAGVTFSESAAQKLVDDLRRVQVQMPDGTIEKQLGLYVEPVQLQVVCYRLWENKSGDDREINEKDLDSVGNVNDSLAEYYAASIAKVAQSNDTPERSIREWFERKLISSDGIRGQVRMGAENSDNLPNTVVRKLVDAHIIRAEQRAGQIWVELSHDRMIEPVRENNRKWFDSNLHLFQRQASLWVDQNRSEGLLLRGSEFEKAEQESKQIQLTPDEKDYLDACKVMKQRALRDQNQKRWIVAGLVGSILLFFVALYYSISATSANLGLIEQRKIAESASTLAIIQKDNAYAASTKAVEQQYLAETAQAKAINQQATAEWASTQAVASANTAATAEAVAMQQRDFASRQEQLALEQQKKAEAGALVAQSILEQNQGNVALTNLLAVAAFKMNDDEDTRTRLLVPVGNSGGLLLFKTSSTALTPTLGFGADNNLITSIFSGCPQDNYFVCTPSGLIKIWKIQNTGKSPTQLVPDPNPIIGKGPMLDAFTVSPDGTTIAVAECDPNNENIFTCEQENIILLDLKTRTQVGQTMSLTGSISNQKSVSLVYSPDGKMLALSINTSNGLNSSPSFLPAISLWDVQSNTRIGQLDLPNGVAQMTFSPNSKTLAIANSRGLFLLDVATVNSANAVLPKATSSTAITSLAYSPDGKILALGNNDRTITLMNTTTLKLFGQPYSNQNKNQNSVAESLAFSPDGKILASGHRDGGVYLWDVSSQTKLFGPLYNHIIPVNDDYPVFDMAFSSDGKLLVTSSNEIILWNMDPASWIDKACRLAGRDFTPNEWQTYMGDKKFEKTCP